MGDVFHAGERAAQARAGVDLERVAAFGSRMLRDTMPDQHRQFFADLPFVLVGAVDGEGWPVASALAGPPGFIASPDERHLRIAARPAADDPLAQALGIGAQVGLLGIMLENRRRNRMNGRVSAADDGGFTVAVDQSFGNCPQYITMRQVRAVEAEDHRAERLDGLDQEACALIARADTFFVASHAGGGSDAALHGVDISHRGGPPGFVTVGASGTLTVPDYAGNRLFNTLGNLLLNPRAGLLFIDVATGDLLHLQGLAEVTLNGEERFWTVRGIRGLRRRGALPLRWESTAA